MNRVYIIPVGDVKVEILSRIVPCLEERFLFRFKTMPSMPVPGPAYNVIKKKYLSSVICEKVKSMVPPDAKFVLAFTDVDTYDNSSSFVYNYAGTDDKVGLISLHRLNPSAGARDEDRDRDVFFQRILKEATHEIGHLMGFRHCFNSICVMYFSYSLNDTDKKETFFCQECEKKLSKMTQNY
jgi:archaemetzincin